MHHHKLLYNNYNGDWHVGRGYLHIFVIKINTLNK